MNCYLYYKSEFNDNASLILILFAMEVPGFPGFIKTINDGEEVEDFSEESDVEVEVRRVIYNLYSYQKAIYFL